MKKARNQDWHSEPRATGSEQLGSGPSAKKSPLGGPHLTYPSGTPARLGKLGCARDVAYKNNVSDHQSAFRTLL
jgi:hypothetical protein